MVGERKARDIVIDVTWAAMLTACDRLRIQDFAGDEFVEPPPATGDRGDQRGASLQLPRAQRELDGCRMQDGLRVFRWRYDPWNDDGGHVIVDGIVGGRLEFHDETTWPNLDAFDDRIGERIVDVFRIVAGLWLRHDFANLVVDVMGWHPRDGTDICSRGIAEQQRPRDIVVIAPPLLPGLCR